MIVYCSCCLCRKLENPGERIVGHMYRKEAVKQLNDDLVSLLRRQLPIALFFPAACCFAQPGATLEVCMHLASMRCLARV